MGKPRPGSALADGALRTDGREEIALRRGTEAQERELPVGGEMPTFERHA